jgi:hypothetical protein
LLGGPSALLVDPLGFDAGDSNLYRYVNNAPTGELDPMGLQNIPMNPNDNSKAGHVFISVWEERKAGVFKGGDPKAVPISIQLTAAGAKPFVTRTNPETDHPSVKQEEINENPWLGFGGPGVKVGQQVRGNFLTLEWIITFSGNPRNCKWGRNMVKNFKFVSRTGEAIISHYEGERSNVVTDDSTSFHDYIVGNKVYMYDSPGAIISSWPRVFEVWAKSADGSKRISQWCFVDSDAGEAYKIPSPTFHIKEPLPTSFGGSLWFMFRAANSAGLPRPGMGHPVQIIR